VGGEKNYSWTGETTWVASTGFLSPNRVSDLDAFRTDAAACRSYLAARIFAAVAPLSAAGGGNGGDDGGRDSAAATAAAAMKTPVAAAEQLCNIFYSSEHGEGSKGVACDQGHFVWSECLTAFVESEFDTMAGCQ
jgi:hypothetical protein